MRFNEGRRTGSPGRSRAVIAAGALAAVLAASGGAARGTTAGESLGPAQAQALSRVMAARTLCAAIEKPVWSGLDPAAIPVLFVEERPGRAPFVLLVGHPDPPSGLRAVETAREDGPPVLVGSSLRIPPEAASPWSLNGKPTALYRRGGALWPTTVGDLPAEREILAVVHHMIHVHLAASGGEVFAHREAPPPLEEAPPEITALASLESRILAEILYTSQRKQAYVAELVRQLLAVRKARRALMGERSASMDRVETGEGPAVYTEYEILRLTGSRELPPPPAGPAESAYSAFQYGVVWRLDRIFEPLLEPAGDPLQAARRAPLTGAALAVALDRLQVDWRPRMTAEGGPPLLEDLLAERVGLEASQQEESLRQARVAFDFSAILDLVRERAKVKKK